ncbi:MAG: DUF5615 family PIN-like protein, partial [Candidatus Micrarchaeia archaeon]
MKLLFDEMLGNTASWVRILGIDSAYVRDMDDDSVIRLAKRQNRILITRDKLLAEKGQSKGVRTILLKTTDIAEQLCTLRNTLNLKFGFPDRTRCPGCNMPLKITGKDNVKEIIPRNVLARHRKFWFCKKCNKAYWEGSHWKNILRMFRKISSC